MWLELSKIHNRCTALKIELRWTTNSSCDPLSLKKGYTVPSRAQCYCPAKSWCAYISVQVHKGTCFQGMGRKKGRGLGQYPYHWCYWCYYPHFLINLWHTFFPLLTTLLHHLSSPALCPPPFSILPHSPPSPTLLHHFPPTPSIIFTFLFYFKYPFLSIRVCYPM